MDQSLLESLPVMNQDYIATLSRFLDTGSLGTGGMPSMSMELLKFSTGVELIEVPYKGSPPPSST